MKLTVAGIATAFLSSDFNYEGDLTVRISVGAVRNPRYSCPVYVHSTASYGRCLANNYFVDPFDHDGVVRNEIMTTVCQYVADRSFSAVGVA